MAGVSSSRTIYLSDKKHNAKDLWLLELEFFFFFFKQPKTYAIMIRQTCIYTYIYISVNISPCICPNTHLHTYIFATMNTCCFCVLSLSLSGLFKCVLFTKWVRHRARLHRPLCHFVGMGPHSHFTAEPITWSRRHTHTLLYEYTYWSCAIYMSGNGSYCPGWIQYLNTAFEKPLVRAGDLWMRQSWLIEQFWTSQKSTVSYSHLFSSLRLIIYRRWK